MKFLSKFFFATAFFLAATPSRATYVYYQDTGDYRNPEFARIEALIYEGLSSGKLIMHYRGTFDPVLEADDRNRLLQVSEFFDTEPMVMKVDHLLISEYTITENPGAGGYILSPTYRSFTDMSQLLFDIHADELKKFLGEKDARYLHDLFLKRKTTLSTIKVIDVNANGQMKNSAKYALRSLHAAAAGGTVSAWFDELCSRKVSKEEFLNFGRNDIVQYEDPVTLDFFDTTIRISVNPEAFRKCQLTFLHSYEDGKIGNGSLYAIAPLEWNQHNEGNYLYYYFKFEEVKNVFPEYYKILDTFFKTNTSPFAYVDYTYRHIPGNKEIIREIWTAVEAGKMKFNAFHAATIPDLKYNIVRSHIPVDDGDPEGVLVGLVPLYDTAGIAGLFRDTMLSSFTLSKQWNLDADGRLGYRNDSLSLMFMSKYDFPFIAFKVATADLRTALNKQTQREWEKILKNSDRLYKAKQARLELRYDSSAEKSLHFMKVENEEYIVVNFKDEDRYIGSHQVSYLIVDNPDDSRKSVYVVSIKKKK